MKTLVRLMAILKAQEVRAEKEYGLRILNSFKVWSFSSGCKICTNSSW